MLVVNIAYFSFLFLFGVCIGSFINAWVWRTRENLCVTKGRSMCPKCRVKLKWYDNIPILSFLILRAKCRNCHTHIPHDYFLTEIWMGLIYLFVPLRHGLVGGVFSVELIRDWVVIFFLTFIFLYDLKYKEIRDFSTIPTSIILFVLSLGFGWHTWQSMFLGIAIGAGFFLAQYVISKGKWIGGGDIRLGMFMGVILGFPGILVALLFAYVFGALFSLVFVLAGKRKLTDETPFGTFLVIATFVTMFWGSSLITLYLSYL